MQTYKNVISMTSPDIPRKDSGRELGKKKQGTTRTKIKIRNKLLKMKNHKENDCYNLKKVEKKNLQKTS